MTEDSSLERHLRRHSRTLPARSMPCYDEDEAEGLTPAEQHQMIRALCEIRPANSFSEGRERCRQLMAMRDSLSDEAIAACQGRTPLPPQSLLAPPPNPPVAEPRRIDTHAASLAALEGRVACGGSLQGQTPPRCATPEPPAIATCPGAHSQPRPQPRPRPCRQPQARPSAIYVESPGGTYEIPVVIHQIPVVVHEVPVLLTPELGTPRAQSPKPASMREPVKRFFKKAVARFGRRSSAAARLGSSPLPAVEERQRREGGQWY
ncbi:hypothetical protein PG985_006659 [Apiospora marii]|uniref:Uncharacterized protein n=1 Tax=Apiospora marii TaxID=335849 RepID=A0ABR1S9K2_9PEZI